VFDRLNEADGAIVPMENTLDGFLSQTIDELMERRWFLAQECIIPVQYACLIRGDQPSDCRRLYVQFAAMGQCQKFIASMPDHIERVMTSSNMESYRLLAKGQQGDGAIVPIHQTDGFAGLIVRDVADSKENATRFVLVKKTKQEQIGGSIRIAVAVTPLEDRPGLLYDLLGIFKQYGVNLSAILSRPAKSIMGTYRFYLEMIGGDSDEAAIRKAVEKAQDAFDIVVLGIYPAVLHPKD
jgi:prephenate dehydratase